MGLFGKKPAAAPTASPPGAAVATDGQTAAATETTAAPATPQAAAKPKRPAPIVWNQGQLNPRSFTVYAGTEAEARAFFETQVCKPRGLDPAKATITIKTGVSYRDEGEKFTGVFGTCVIPKPEKPAKPAAKAADAKGEGKSDAKAAKPAPVKHSPEETTRLQGIAKKHGVTFEAPYSFYGPDKGKVEAALAEAFPGASTTVTPQKRGGTFGIGGKMTNVGTATPAPTVEATPADVTSPTEAAPTAAGDDHGQVVIGLDVADTNAEGGAKPVSAKGAATAGGGGAKPKPEVTPAQRRAAVEERRQKVPAFAKWLTAILDAKHGTYGDFLTALLDGAEKAAKDRSQDTAGAFRLLAWYVAAAVLVNARPPEKDPPGQEGAFKRWTEAARAFVNRAGSECAFGEVLPSSALTARLALAGLEARLTIPELFKKGEVFGLAEEGDEGEGPAVDPVKVFDDAKTAGAKLADEIRLDLAPEASEGLPALVRDLLEKMAKAISGQGSRTKVAAVLVTVDVAVPVLLRFLGSTKGADGSEGDDPTIEATSLLLAKRVKPAVTLKPADLAVAILRAVYAIRENV